MASVDYDIELEDGEINDLEDGEIDEDILLPTESSNDVFSRLEPRQEDPLRDQQDSVNNSHGVNNRDFVSHHSGPLPGRWEPPLNRGRFPRGRVSPLTARGRGRGRGFRGNGREMTGRGKSFLARKASQHRGILYYTYVL